MDLGGQCSKAPSRGKSLAHLGSEEGQREAMPGSSAAPQNWLRAQKPEASR